MDDATLVATRRSLHAVAETLLAGPQHRRSGTIRLAISREGFRTWPTTGPPTVSVRGTALVIDDNAELVLPLLGTIGELATTSGLDLGAPEDVYDLVSAVAASDQLHVDEVAAGQIAAAFAIGDEALRVLAPQDDPILWPEHFDVSTTVGEIGYGVSPGDSLIAEPYAYVGPRQRRRGAFWNQPFGAATTVRELGGAQAVLDYFRRGQAQAAIDPTVD